MKHLPCQTTRTSLLHIPIRVKVVSWYCELALRGQQRLESLRFRKVCIYRSCKASHAQGSIRIAGSEVWVANKWSHIRNGKMQVFKSSLNVFTVFFQPLTYFPLTWGHWLESCAKTFKPKRLTKPVFLCITIGPLQKPMNNYHSDALFAFMNLMHFRASCCFIAINDFNVTLKKVSLWNSPKRFHAVLSSSRYTWWPLYAVIFLRSLFLIKISFIGGQFIPVFLS